MILRGERTTVDRPSGECRRTATYPWVGVAPGTLWWDQPQQEWPVVSAVLAATSAAGVDLGDAVQVECVEGVVTSIHVTCDWSPPRFDARMVNCGRCSRRHPVGLYYNRFDMSAGIVERGMIYDHPLYAELGGS